MRTLVCRTFSDCTTAPRNGLRSGCYPLDEFYNVALCKRVSIERDYNNLKDNDGKEGTPHSQFW